MLTVDNAWTYEEGTPFLVDAVSDAGALPTRNWRTGTFDGAAHDQLDDPAGDPHQAARLHAVPAGVPPGARLRGLRLRGPRVRDARPLRLQLRRQRPRRGGRLQSRLRRARPRHDVHGRHRRRWRWSSARRAPPTTACASATPPATCDAPRLIAAREGFGAELALGARALAALKGRPELAIEVKGLEMPAYDPRGTFGMGLGYATSDRGACHMRAFSAGDDILGGEGAADSLAGKARLVADQQDFSSVAWTGVWCANMAVDTDFLGVHFRHLWGRETSHEELMTIGARIWNLGRLLNLREGLRRADDRLPERILSVPHRGRRRRRQGHRRRGLPRVAGRVLPAARTGTPHGVPSRAKTGRAVARRSGSRTSSADAPQAARRARGRRDAAMAARHDVIRRLTAMRPDRFDPSGRRRGR